MTSLYDTLGIDKDATIDDIKAAHRSAAKKHHPDVNPDGDPKVFLEIQRAYEVLSDKEAREFYDTTGQEDKNTVVYKGDLRASEAFLQALVETDKNPHEFAIRLVKAEKATFRKKVNSVHLFKIKFEKALKKLTKKGGGESVLHSKLSIEILNCDESIKENEYNMLICDRALEVLDDYSFDGSIDKEILRSFSKMP